MIGITTKLWSLVSREKIIQTFKEVVVVVVWGVLVTRRFTCVLSLWRILLSLILLVLTPDRASLLSDTVPVIFLLPIPMLS